MLAENERIKSMKVDHRLISICEENGWTVDESDDNYIELWQKSPAGEDFCACIAKEKFTENVRAYEGDFSVDEHVELWIPSRGENGCPLSIRALVEDAEAIKMMLGELALALEDKQSEIDNEEGSIDEFLQDQ